MTVDSDLCTLLAKYPRAIVHLRSQVQKKRFGAVVGAGVSIDFGVPGWGKLVTSIASDPEVDGLSHIAGAASDTSFPYKIEVLFQHFQNKRSTALATLTTLERLNTITAEWLKICSKYLYDTPAAKDMSAELQKHPYLESLIPLVQASGLTVNFNFDDYLERALAAKKRLPEDEGNRGYEAVTDPWPQFRRTDCVIYHPHGYVPFGLMEKAVDRFVFSEAAYSKQYVGARGHDTSFLLAHFARNTCLMIGCSLEDELRNILMRGSEINPGNYHYYIHWVNPEKPISADEQKLISATNFKIYNLVTLFLTSREINSLLKLINGAAINESKLKDLAARCSVKLKYTFYMTGPLGVGKSTTTNHLRSLTVLDEWLVPRLEILGIPWDKLTPDEQKQADEWIADQFKKKNDSLRHEERPVISVVDRPPLDPLVFTSLAERPAKAKSLIETICPGRAYNVESGVVILLLGDPKELSARVRATGRVDYDESRLKRMQDDMISLYKDLPGTVVVNTQFLSISDLTRQVAEIIHREEYRPVDLMAEMQRQEGLASATTP